MIPLSADSFNALRWKPVDGMELDSLIQGLTVVGAEPTDYPLTDAITLYLRAKDGAILALDIGTDPDTSTGFYIRKATAEQDIIERSGTQ